QMRDALYGIGLFEVMTYSFVSEAQVSDLGLEPEKHLKLKNPMSQEQAYLRSTLLPSHLATLVRNRTYAQDVGFYELSSVFLKEGKGEQPDEPLRLAIMWRRPEGALLAVKGAMDVLARELNVDMTAGPADDPWFVPGRSGRVMIGTKHAGRIGQV